jgi:membrane associated rhomboid family serine protease
MLNFLAKYPATSIIAAVNIWIFLLIKINFIPVPLVLPGDFSLWSNLGHFSHTAPMHIVFNVIILLQIGTLLEPKLGATKFIIITLLIWGLLIAISSPFNTHPSLGFSGILMGLVACTAILFRHSSAIFQNLGSLVVINIFIGFLPGISFVMHLWGAIAGAIIAGVMVFLFDE